MSDRGAAGPAVFVGVFVAAACVVFLVAAVLVAQSSGDDASVFELQLGDCIAQVDDVDGNVDSVALVECSAEHVGEVVDVGLLNPEGDRVYPGPDVLFGEIEERCRSALTPYVDSGLDPSEFAPLPIAPEESAWSPTRGRYSCVAMRLGGTLGASLANGG